MNNKEFLRDYFWVLIRMKCDIIGLLNKISIFNQQINKCFFDHYADII